MTNEQFLKNLEVPKGKIDVVLDTDAYNEIDDQFAICYMIKNSDKFNIKGICAAPFHNINSDSPKDGMEKSYDEILKLLDFMDMNSMRQIIYKGSECYLKDEETPVESDAADFIAELSNSYSPENPLYIVAIGAITNVASAVLKNPAMIENTVIVWLGGHGQHIYQGVNEFNMVQDIAAARIIFGCGVPLVQLPCGGVVSHFATSRYELEYWLKGKNKVCDYLVENTIAAAESYAKGKPWTRPIWDVTAVAWLLNEEGHFMQDELRNSPIPEYNYSYSYDKSRHLFRYVTAINRDALFEDLFDKLSKKD